MARVTVEDCVDKITNRFELVVLSAQRAKQIASGAPLTVERDNDKEAVIALREIAEQTIDLAQMEEEVIAAHSSYKMSESYHEAAESDAEPEYEELVAGDQQDVAVETSEEPSEEEADSGMEAGEAMDLESALEPVENELHEDGSGMSFVDMDENVND